MPFTVYNAPLGKKKALHLLRRTCFAYTKADVDTFANYTPSQAVDLLFQDTALPEPPVDPATGLTWIGTLSNSSQKDQDLQEYFKAWWQGQMLPDLNNPDRLSISAREKVVFWLHTFFTAIQGTIGNSRALYYQNTLLRKFALDGAQAQDINMKVLTQKISLDSAMIILLDGQLNVKGNPNENYARELFELYSIGKGLSGHVPPTTTLGDYIYFTEEDVQSAARVLSGYVVDDKWLTIDPDTSLPRAKVNAGANGTVSTHDEKDKVFSNRLGNRVIAADTSLLINGKPSEASMHDELKQLIDLVYEQTETHKHVCRRLYRYYMYHLINPTIDNDLIADLVTTFVANNFKIEPVIRKIVTSVQFYDSVDADVKNDQFGSIIKSPLELAINTLSMFEVNIPDNQAELVDRYAYFDKLNEYCSDMGMRFMNPSDVAGHEAYYQYPIYNRAWINSMNLSQRYNFILRVSGMESMESPIKLNFYAFVKKHFDAEAKQGIDELLKAVIPYFLPMYELGDGITVERYEYFKQRFSQLGLVDPLGANNFWKQRWPSADNFPQYKMEVSGMLADLFNALLQSPEYQLA